MCLQLFQNGPAEVGQVARDTRGDEVAIHNHSCILILTPDRGIYSRVISSDVMTTPTNSTFYDVIATPTNITVRNVIATPTNNYI